MSVREAGLKGCTPPQGDSEPHCRNGTCANVVELHG